MRWQNYAGSACLLLSFVGLFGHAGAHICDPSKPNDGCSPFGRCDKPTLTCQCNPGFLGDGKECESICSSVNQTCKSIPEAVSCVDLPFTSTSHSCLCKEGYSWNPTVQQCLDIDECALNLCDPYSKCTNLPGSYSCECCYSEEGWQGVDGFGYVGDGKVACYADSILPFGHSLYQHNLTTNGAVHTKWPGGFPYYGELYNDIYVHLDGFVTFGTENAPYLGGDAFPTHRHVKFVAPFWTDLKVSDEPGSGLYVDGYSLFKPYGNSEDNSHYYGLFGNPIEKFRASKQFYGFIDEIGWKGFHPTVMLTATWVNMTVEGSEKFVAGTKTRITFQGVLVTNGTHSFGFQSYSENPKDTEWNAPLESVYIGLSGENFANRIPISEISHLFQSPFDEEDVCQSMTFLSQRGRMFAPFGPPYLENNNAYCLAEASLQGQKHAEFRVEPMDTEGNWLPPELYCPCFEDQAFSDDRFMKVNFEKAPLFSPPAIDRHSCHISQFFKAIHTDTKDYRARAYCCYDSEGALVTKGTATGGIIPEGFENDVMELKKKCCIDAKMCDVFQRMYRPVTCHRYEPPVKAYVRGAGHFDVLGGTKYNFNGKGEYELFFLRQLGAAKAQLRMVDRTSASGKVTSFVTAMVAQCNVPRLPNDTADFVTRRAEVRVNKNRELELLVDEEKAEIGQFPKDLKTTFLAGCTPQYCQVSCKYQKQGITFHAYLETDYLFIDLTLPRVKGPSVRGLLGTNGGKLIYNNGDEDIYVTDKLNDTQIRAFGENYRIQNTTSLFTYDSGDSWETYNKDGENFKPTLWSEIKFDFDNMDEVCHCEGDHGCQYDQIVTGSKEISLASLQSSKYIANDRASLQVKTPQWEMDPVQTISIHQQARGSLRDVVKTDELNESLEPDGFQLSTNIFDWLYEFNTTSGEYVIHTDRSPDSWRYNNFFFSIYAFKKGPQNKIARSVQTPDLYVCACDKEEQCDYSYMARTPAFRPALEEKYYVLPCKCPPNVNTRFCTGEFDICATTNPCDKNAVCTNDKNSPSGYTCTCNNGYTGNGLICNLNQCPKGHGCGQLCSLDPVTAAPICSCNAGYVLNDDGKTCRDRNECNFPNSCPDPKAICVNTEGSYYCECEAGFKPMKGPQRWGCLQTDRTYLGSLTFEKYWDMSTKQWLGWDDFLGNPSFFGPVARQLETFIEDLIKLIEPVKGDMYTYVHKFSKDSMNRITASFKIYPYQNIDTAVFKENLKQYITLRKNEAAGLKGIDPSTTLNLLHVQDFCTQSSCNSPFATCHNADESKKCSCNPGFIFNTDVTNTDMCRSYCSWKNCDQSTSYSCRDLAESGPQCLCKKGFALNTQNSCYKKSACPTDSNPCGKNAQCHDKGDGTYDCVCDKGFVRAAKPSPDLCVPDVMLFRGDDQHDISDGAVINEFAGYYKLAIPVGFPYFDSKQWKIFVGPRGVLTFGKNITASELLSFHPSTYGYLAAPFWTDFTGDKNSTHIKVYDATVGPLTEQWKTAIDEIRNTVVTAQSTFPSFDMFGYPKLRDPTRFDPKTVIVVTWTDLKLRPFADVDRMSLQAIIASDGVATVFISNYDAKTTSISSWEDPATESDPEKAYYHRGFVGFQAGHRQICLNRVSFGESKTDCRSFNPRQFFENKGEGALPPGRFAYLVANDEDVSVKGDRQCFDVLRDVRGTQASIEMNYVYSRIGELFPDPCPWTETMVKLDSRFDGMFSPDREKSCYTRKFSSPLNYTSSDGETKTANIRPFCCYRYNSLLTQADSFTHMIIEEFADIQSKIQSACCVSGHHCTISNMFVPAIYTSGYEPPVTAGIYGDPHLFTFAGLEVTFKGHGDYVLFKSINADIHGRFDAIGADNDGAGLMGVAWKIGAFPKVIAQISTVDGKWTFKSGDKAIDVADGEYTKPFGFKEDGHIESKLNEKDEAISVKVTYVCGLSIELLRLATKKQQYYLHMRIRMPKPYLQEAHTGLLADFIYPDGSPYQPKHYGTLFMGDQHYFLNYGKNWTVENAGEQALFDSPAPLDTFVPTLFYEKYLIDIDLLNPDRPIFDGKCHKSVACAYDYVATNEDEVVAQATYDESTLIRKRRQHEVERPPVFGRNPFVWLINVKALYFEYAPVLDDMLSEDIRFTFETNMPRSLITEFDPFTGRVIVMMSEEAREILLNKGPFEFYFVATRGETGSSIYKPVAVRICNCGEDQSCDWSDDFDSIAVGVFPTLNRQHYSSVRCNCFSFQAGKYCDQPYKACRTQPCYPGVPCFDLHIADFKKPSFSCGGCPYGYKSDDFLHCTVVNPCKGVTCDEGKVCENVNGYGKCVCPPGVSTKPDGTCYYPDRCEQEPAVCTGDGQRCNAAPFGAYYCDCMPGYVPRYKAESTLLELMSCEQVSYTFVGSVTFERFYLNGVLETYTNALQNQAGAEFQTFARRIIYDMTNAFRLLRTTDITGLQIRAVTEVPESKGFVVDFFVYSNKYLDKNGVQAAMAKYFSQTNSVGVIVNVKEPPKLVDVCDSKYSPCESIKPPELRQCMQNGRPGEGATCKCDIELGYQEVRVPSGYYICRDVCDGKCKVDDPKSKCQRDPNNPLAKYQCVCTTGTYKDTKTGKCIPYPPVCTETSCGPNAKCVPVNETNFVCLCHEGFDMEPDKTCKSHCEKSNNCKNIANTYGCQNEKEGFTCLCNAGFTWKDAAKTCEDIDECATGAFTCPKSATCVNRPGSYECKCGDDYSPGDDKHSVCYAKKEKILYPYNFYKQPPYVKYDEEVKFLVPGGFNYFDNPVYAVHVGFDGYIGLDYSPPHKYFGDVLSTNLLAPFWMDLDVKPNDPTSGFYIDAYDIAQADPNFKEQWEKVFAMATKDLQTQYPDSHNPDLWNKDTIPINNMLILTWVNVVPQPASEFGKFHTTFQAIIGANSAFSFAIYNFLEDPKESVWPTAAKMPELQPRIGYTQGTYEVRFESLNGENPDFSAVFKDGPHLRGRLVHGFGRPADVTARRCIQRYKNFPENILKILMGIDKLGTGLRMNSACPNFMKQMQLDARWQPELEIGDAVCYGGSFWHEANDTTFTHQTYHVRSFCCYDIASGAYLGYPGAHVSSYVQIQEYEEEQSTMFDDCCQNSQLCELFATKNPAYTIAPEYYQQPAIAYIRGDPHIGLPVHIGDKTNRQITFNGRGEYTLVKSLVGKTVIQARFQMKESISQLATFVTGVAIKTDEEEIIEIVEHDGKVNLLRNGEQVDLTEIILPGTHEVVEMVSYDIWAAKDFIGYVTRSGISLHIYQSHSGGLNIRMGLPQYMVDYLGTATCGLLTAFESKPYQDCDRKQAVGDALNDEEAAYAFGQQFKVKQREESLFSYKVGPSFEEINNVSSDWKPMFSENLPPEPADLVEVCGTRDRGCKFDYRITKNKEIATNTREFGEMLLGIQKYSVLPRPKISNPTYFPFELTLSNIGETFELDIDTEEEKNGTEGFYYNIASNLDPRFYTFNANTGVFKLVATREALDDVRKRDDAPFLRFVAIQGDATALWMPSVFTSVCEKAEQIDTEFGEREFTQRPHNLEHGYFVPCLCPAYARGKFCEIPFDPCSENPCGETKCAYDESSPTGFTCGACPPGTVWSGGRCRPKVCPDNLCTNGECYVDTKDGSFKCKCNAGYQMASDNDKVCRDINECQLGSHDCYHLGSGFACTNTPGSWICGCKNGYAPDNVDHMTTCVISQFQAFATLKMNSVLVGAREVTWDNALFDQASPLYQEVAKALQASLLAWYTKDLQASVSSIVIIKLTSGSIVADYAVNFANTFDGAQLIKREKDFLQAGGTIAGVKGVDANSVKMTSDPCEGDTTCDATSTQCRWDAAHAVKRCECLEGYSPNPKSDLSCVDDCTNFCTKKLGHNAKCERSFNGFKCGCITNYFERDGQCINKCTDLPCKNGGTCGLTADGRGYTCSCAFGFLGLNCETRCQCQNGGVCTDQINPNKCSCVEGYGGQVCGDCGSGFLRDPKGTGKCIPVCSTNPCQHGTCSARNNVAVCSCDAGWDGDKCDKCAVGFGLVNDKCESKCKAHDCGAHGECGIKDGEPACICKDKYTGDKCQDAPPKEDTSETDRQNLVIVSAVLGSICFILLCVVIGFGCFTKKNKKAAAGNKNTHHRASDDEVPEIEIRQPAHVETAFAGVVQAAPPAIPVQVNEYAVQASKAAEAYAAPPANVYQTTETVQQPVIFSTPAQMPPVYKDVAESEDF